MHERAWIHDYILPLITAPGAAGLSDDVALLRHGRIPLISMDTLVSGVHFLPGDPLGTVGQKLVRVNVSDIHAKGARPLEAMLSIAWPEALCERDFRALMSGIGQDLKRFGCDLIGGDLVHTPGPLTLTLTLTGDCLGDAPVRRSDGQIGDGIFIHGEIGWGGLGLEAARTGQAPGLAERYRVPDISDITAAGTVWTCQPGCI